MIADVSITIQITQANGQLVSGTVTGQVKFGDNSLLIQEEILDSNVLDAVGNKVLDAVLAPFGPQISTKEQGS